ncbi:NAD(P)H-quinone oxidoreductase [Chondrinema litorale]|uniref:NAD(P)H-quinone oxidoreductase n=1 Tax=Chondrinema litorale TaxID=2994555 RepID=UPI002542DC71|nr:NAD(P)H-quinone oxidoreductase [Chondrinema litorale]UZR93898.1 NAD(P)H-quinone oxidoreductase [Chondrinema litorale]
MKAIISNGFGGPEVLSLGEAANPEVNEEEILIKVAATALNRADTLQREGKYPPPKGESQIIGLEAAGVVEQTGKAVTKWKKGDKVCCLLAGGAYAEYVKVHQHLAMPVPQTLSLEESAAIPEVFLTAYQALISLCEMQEGEKVLIHAGGSGVGTAAIQLAKLRNAEIFVTASKTKHQTCFDLGANHAIDYKSQDFAEEIKELTKGKGVDVVIDFMGASYFKKNLDVMGMDGRMVMLAWMGGFKLDSLNLVPVLSKRLKIMGSTLRARSVDYKKTLIEGFTNDFVPYFDKGELKPVIDTVMSWSAIQEAHTRMDANLNTGKIILKVD